MSTDRYQSPLSERYASKEMQYIFSPDMKFRTWRKLWIALAETEKELGLGITQEQIDEMKAHMDDINYARRCELTGKLLIVAPDDTCGVSTLCREPEALLRLYDKGRQDGRKILDFL